MKLGKIDFYVEYFTAELSQFLSKISTFFFSVAGWVLIIRGFLGVS